MHYFKMNIGDYAKKAGRLSMLEHGAYTLLIHACYDRERFPTLEEAFDWCWVRTQDEEDAVRFVLSKFFTLDGEIYVQNRIKEEIDKYHETSETNKRIATEREEKRRKKARTVNASCESVNEAPPNQEPLTINQEPNTVKTHTDYCSLEHEENENNYQILSDDQTEVDHKLQNSKQTPAASVCISIKKQGISDVNPAHPELLMLIDAGATLDEFVYAARTAKDKGKGFAYILGIVKKQRENVKAMAGKLHEGRLPNKQESLEQRNFSVAENWIPQEMRVKA